MQAGRLRHRVQFTRRRAGTDELGQPDVNFDPLFIAWCDVQPVSGREFFNAAHHVDNVDAKICLRYLPFYDLKATDRAQVLGPQGGEYDITAVLAPEMAGDRLMVYAKRVD
jgi:SPP1 family predicted phage head-tail adaptor